MFEKVFEHLSRDVGVEGLFDGVRIAVRWKYGRPSTPPSKWRVKKNILEHPSKHYSLHPSLHPYGLGVGTQYGRPENRTNDGEWWVPIPPYNTS